MVAVLQCLQRLTSSRFASADMVISPLYAARIFSALTCGDDAVATEVTHSEAIQGSCLQAACCHHDDAISMKKAP